MKILITFLLAITFTFSQNYKPSINALQNVQNGSELIFAKKYEEAYIFLKTANEQKPELLNAAVLLSKVYEFRKDYDSAEMVLLPQLNFNPDSQAVYTQLSKVLRLNGKIVDSQNMIDLGLKKAFFQGELAWQKARLYNAVGKYDSAVVMWNHGIKSEPMYNENYFSAGMYFKDTKKKYLSAILFEFYLILIRDDKRHEETSRLLYNIYNNSIKKDDKGKLYFDLFDEKNLTDFAKDYRELLNEALNTEITDFNGQITLKQFAVIRQRFITNWADKGLSKKYDDQFTKYLLDLQDNGLTLPNVVVLFNRVISEEAELIIGENKPMFRNQTRWFHSNPLKFDKTNVFDFMKY